jgi:hypothetical protein
MTSPQDEPGAQALGESLAALAAQVASLRGQVAPCWIGLDRQAYMAHLAELRQ